MKLPTALLCRPGPIHAGQRLVWVFLWALLTVAMFTGCESTSGSVQTSAPTSPLGASDAIRAAMDIQDAGEGRTAGLGSGNSMQPLYDENTVLIIAPIAYEDLERGMLVAYRNSQGRRVVHTLIWRDTNGWIAQGLGNNGADRDRVTIYNLEGVVYGAFFAMK